MVEIVLPYSADGFYRFGDLPWRIANALAPEDENLKDWIRCVWCWKDDGTAEGSFTRRLAPDGVLTESVQDSDAWPAEPFDLSKEPADRSRSNLFARLWATQRQAPESHHYLSDGSLVIHHDDEPNGSLRDATRRLHMSNYTETLNKAADDGALVVCNCSGLPHSFPHGQARLDSVVHIDELNRWGATLPGGQQFKMAGAISQEEEPNTQERGIEHFIPIPATPTEVPELLRSLSPREYVRYRRVFDESGGGGACTADALIFQFETTIARQLLGRYTIDEAADVLAKNTGDTWGNWRQRIVEAIQNKSVAAYDAGCVAPRIGATRLIDSCLHEVYGVDLNEWLTANFKRVVYRFPHPKTATERVTVVQLDWSLRKPKRFQGYARPLYEHLSFAHTSGQTRPKARDVLEAWRANKPPEIAIVMADSLDYYDADGGTKPADLEALRKAIGRMTTTGAPE